MNNFFVKLSNLITSKKNRLEITIKNCNTKTTVKFVATPDSIGDTYTANFDEKNIIGRNSPILVYSGGSSRGLSFSVTFHEDIIPEDDIRVFIDRIKALSFPVYSNGIHPPKVYAKIGDMFSFWGILNTEITYKPPYRNGRFIIADVAFTFTRIGSVNNNSTLFTEDPISATDIEENGLDRR